MLLENENRNNKFVCEYKITYLFQLFFFYYSNNKKNFLLNFSFGVIYSRAPLFAAYF